MGLNGYLVLLLGFQRVGLLKRGGGEWGGEEDGLLMHAPIPAVFSLFFLSLSFFPFFFYVTPFLVFITFFPWVLLPWVPLFWMPPPPTLPPLFSSMATTPLYNGPISWNFSLLPLGLYQLFLVCCRHPLRTAHQPFGCSATTTIG